MAMNVDECLQRVCTLAEQVLKTNSVHTEEFDIFIESVAVAAPFVCQKRDGGVVTETDDVANTTDDALYDQIVAYLQSEDSHTADTPEAETPQIRLYRDCLGMLSQLLVKHGHALHLMDPPLPVFRDVVVKPVGEKHVLLSYVCKEYLPVKPTMWHALLAFYWAVAYLEQSLTRVAFDVLTTTACAFSASLRGVCEHNERVTADVLACVAQDLATNHGKVDVTSTEFSNALRFVECSLSRMLTDASNTVSLVNMDYISVRIIHARIARAKMCCFQASLTQNEQPLLFECDVYPLSVVKEFIKRKADEVGLQVVHGMVLKKLLLQTLVPFGQYLLFVRKNNLPPQDVVMMLYATQPPEAVNAMLDNIGGATFHGLDDMMRLCENAPLRLLHTLLAVVQAAVADKIPNVHERLLLMVDSPPDWDELVFKTQLIRIVVCVDVFVLVTRRRVYNVGRDAWACLWALFNALHKQQWMWDGVSVENTFLDS
jgi:hypothetical protein